MLLYKLFGSKKITGFGSFILAIRSPLAVVGFRGHTKTRPGECAKKASLLYEWNIAPCPTAPHGVLIVILPQSHVPPHLYLNLEASLTI